MNAMLEKWTGPALALESVPDRVGVPLAVLGGEAVDAARFAEAHWATKREANGRVVRPGLETAAVGGRFHEGIAQEILELQ